MRPEGAATAAGTVQIVPCLSSPSLSLAIFVVLSSLDPTESPTAGRILSSPVSVAERKAAEDAMLPDLYGGIEGIAQLNRTEGDAAALLANSEQRLASMGIPYVLGVHGAFVSASVEMLRRGGRDDADAKDRDIAASRRD